MALTYRMALLAIGLVIIVSIAVTESPLRADNLLQNPGMELPYVKYGEFDAGTITIDKEVANSWERYFILDGTDENGNDLNYFKSQSIEAVLGFNEKRDGDNSQIWWSKKLFDAGVYQQVAGLTIGEHYGFQAGILQIFGDTSSKINDKMFRSVGMDPTGGTSPTATTVIWGPEESLDIDWFYPGVGATALSSTVTVFIRVRSIEESPTAQENSVFADDTYMDIAPLTNITLTIENDTATASWSGAARDGFTLWAHEAQYRAVTDTTWTDLQIFDSSTEANDIPLGTQATFSVTTGVQYEVRARTWHEASGDEHEVPGPWAVATTETIVDNTSPITGYVIDNLGAGVANATVTLVGTATQESTTSGSDGSFNVLVEPGMYTATASLLPTWGDSMPVYLTAPTSDTITLTLRAADDVIVNGGFENTLAGWTYDITPTGFITDNPRSGLYSLSFISQTVTLSQTSVVSNVNNPTLTFWYWGDSGSLVVELFTTSLMTPTTRYTVPLTSQLWKLATVTITSTAVTTTSVTSADAYTGTLGVQFTVTAGEGPIYLDEVSLGSGLLTTTTLQNLYLPGILKGD